MVSRMHDPRLVRRMMMVRFLTLGKHLHWCIRSVIWLLHTYRMTCDLFSMNLTIQLKISSGMSRELVRECGMFDKSVSKALEKSRPIRVTYGCFSRSVVMCWWIDTRAAVVKPVGRNANWSEMRLEIDGWSRMIDEVPDDNFFQGVS